MRLWFAAIWSCWNSGYSKALVLLLPDFARVLVVCLMKDKQTLSAQKSSVHPTEDMAADFFWEPLAY